MEEKKHNSCLKAILELIISAAKIEQKINNIWKWHLKNVSKCLFFFIKNMYNIHNNLILWVV